MDKIVVEICYSISKDRMFFIALKVPEHSTIEDALNAADIFTYFQHLTVDTISCGIFSKKATLHTTLANNDRIEIYRPLQNTPLQSRINRTNKKTN